MVARTETTASGAFALSGAVAEVGAGAEVFALGGEHQGAGRPCLPIVRWDNDHTSPDCPIVVA